MRFTTPEYRQKLLTAARLILKQERSVIRDNLDLLESAAELRDGWRVDGFRPYAYQAQWFESGAKFRLRYLSAANRIGKTFSAAAEFSYHATGCYPDWWRGYRAPTELIGLSRIMWAIGVSSESTRKVLQKELIGTDDARQRHKFGTGSIPRERINFDSLVCDGETLKSLRVYHESGEETTIHFYSSKQDEKVFMGQAIIFAWIDEQSEKEDELVAQATTRVQTTGGQVVITATPEVGITDLYKRCSEDVTGKIYFQNATIYDAPHFTPEMIDDFIATTPYHQRDMRTKGIPILGVGAIYPFRTADITCAPFEIPENWRVLAALDFGYTGESDPSIIVFIAYDPETGRKYLFREWSNHSRITPLVTERDVYANAHMPDYMASKITGRQPNDWAEQVSVRSEELRTFEGLGIPSIPVVAPNDGNGVQAGTQKTRSEIMRDLGAKMTPSVWKLHESQLPDEPNRVSKEGSIILVAQMFQDGDLKIFNTCTETLRELGLYQWVREGKRTIPSPKNDHFMDAMRYAATRIQFDGVPLIQARRTAELPVDHQNTPYKRAMSAYTKKLGAKKL